jgi:hypothetical protein
MIDSEEVFAVINAEIQNSLTRRTSSHVFARKSYAVSMRIKTRLQAWFLRKTWCHAFYDS